MSSGRRRLDRLMSKIPNPSDKSLLSLLISSTPTVADLLQTHPLVLLASLSEQQQLLIGLKDIHFLLDHVSQSLTPSSRTALDMFRHRDRLYLPTGLPLLDKALRGGLSLGCVSELCGTAGVGKTQMCIQMAVLALTSSLLTPDSGRSVIYIDTELKLDPSRIVQVAVETFPDVYNNNNDNMNQLLQRVNIRRPTSSKELREEIESLQTSAVACKAVLVVIDSIAALSRKENMNERDREEFFVTQAANLKRLAELCNCAVVSTNHQQTTSTSTSGLHQSLTRNQWGEEMLPVLGPTWHHCVSLRLTLSQSSQGREVVVTKSPLTGPVAVKYKIVQSGVVEEEEME